MLENYFRSDHTLRRLRAEPTGRYMDDFAETLHAKGYGIWAGQAYLRAAAHLGIWIKRQGLSAMKLNEEVIGEFARHLPLCRCLGKNQGIYDDAVIGARHFLSHLRDTGVAPAGAPAQKPSLPALIDGFQRWMLQHRGVSKSTLIPYRSILTKLLGAIGETPGSYNAHVLRHGVDMQTSCCGRCWAKLVITTARMFLRYLVVHDLCDPALKAERSFRSLAKPIRLMGPSSSCRETSERSLCLIRRLKPRAQTRIRTQNGNRFHLCVYVSISCSAGAAFGHGGTQYSLPRADLAAFPHLSTGEKEKGVPALLQDPPHTRLD